jgi:hypothetical protein
MQSRLIITLFILSFALTLKSQQRLGLDSYVIWGQLQNKRDSTALPFAHIRNTTQNKGTVSGMMGEFKIIAQYNDTIVISSVGYNPFIYVFIDSLYSQEQLRLIFFLTPKIYEIQEFKVSAFGTYGQFKSAMTNLNLGKDKNKVELNLPTMKNDALSYLPGGGVIISGPFSAMYEKFGKRPKQIREVARLERKLDFDAIRYSDWVMNTVRELTKLEDEEAIKDFIDECALTEEFLESANEYEILMYIKAHYENTLQKQ